MIYEVQVRTSARKAIARMRIEVRAQFEAVLKDLATNPWPANCAKMEGHANEWRLRIGAYRLVYQIYKDELLILVIEAGPRGGMYKQR